MPRTQSPATVVVSHPRTSHEFRIEKTTYDLISNAIIESLRGHEGKTFSELTEAVSQLVAKRSPGFSGSVSWYTISIRLDMETKGLVETFEKKGRKLNRLIG
jgi:hypothetical protein